MSKIRSLQNKATFIGIGTIVGLFLLILINGGMLIPVFIDAYIKKTVVTAKKPIDVETVNQALKFISE